MKMKKFGLIFIGYLKTGGREGGSSEPHEPTLDPPLHGFHTLKSLSTKTTTFRDST